MEAYHKSDIEELENRVKKLMEPYPGQTSMVEIEKPKSSKTKNLMKQLLSEAESNYKDEDEMDNWCVICNEDGDFKCINCDNDVYCKRCFK